MEAVVLVAGPRRVDQVGRVVATRRARDEMAVHGRIAKFSARWVVVRRDSTSTVEPQNAGFPSVWHRYAHERGHDNHSDEKESGAGLGTASTGLPRRARIASGFIQLKILLSQ
jgi:hypothetical protein